jgi:hypothetical protein
MIINMITIIIAGNFRRCRRDTEKKKRVNESRRVVVVMKVTLYFWKRVKTYFLLLSLLGNCLYGLSGQSSWLQNGDVLCFL